jgi:hypothetical protein
MSADLLKPARNSPYLEQRVGVEVPIPERAIESPRHHEALQGIHHHTRHRAGMTLPLAPHHRHCTPGLHSSEDPSKGVTYHVTLNHVP